MNSTKFSPRFPLTNKALFTAITVSFVLIFALSVRTNAQNANSCFAPGVTVLDDPESDVLIGEPVTEQLFRAADIRRVSVAEPFDGGNGRLTFTIKLTGLGPNGMASGLLTLPPLMHWITFFKGSTGPTYYVEMRTGATGIPVYTYGTTVGVLDLLAPVLIQQGTADEGFARPDGTIQITVAKNKVGNPTIGQNFTMSAGAYLIELLGLLSLDRTGSNTYQMRGSVECNPIRNLQFGMNADVPMADDYNRNGTSDFAVWRPDGGNWYILDSVTGAFRSQQLGLGSLGDIPVSADLDGDSKADVAIYRPSQGLWMIFQSATGTVRTQNFGIEEDIPVPADFDGDRVADIAVFRPSSGNWYMILSANGAVSGTHFGMDEDRPQQADYDGDGKDDIAIFRPSAGTWYVLRSSDGGTQGVQFGVGTDVTVKGDYDGDGKSDYAVWRPTAGPFNDGFWYVLHSASNTFHAFQWGLSTDRPTPGDFNGNGRNDYAVWRPSSGTWYVYQN